LKVCDSFNLRSINSDIFQSFGFPENTDIKK